jgi:hypothetical protein
VTGSARVPGRRPAARLVALVLASAVALAGCLDVAVPSTEPTPTPAPEATATVFDTELGTTVYQSGLVFIFERVHAELDQRGGTVNVEVRIQNPTTDVATISWPIRLVYADASYDPTRDTVLPDLPSGAETLVTLKYEIEGHSALAGAAIDVGRAGDHIGVAPLGAGVEAETLEPIDVALKGSATASDLKLTVHGAEVRWDLPDWQMELPADRAVIDIVFDATYTGSFAGGFAFTGDNVALRLPDGTTVKPRTDGHSRPVALIAAGKTKKGLHARFEIPAGSHGKFALIVISGSTRKTVSFTIPG